MDINVQVEKTSNIQCKLTIRVPAKTVNQRLERGLAEVQRTAKIKGFRPGNVPISVVKQYYGSDVRHQVFHNLIDESFKEAVKEQKLRAVGNPQIETPEHKTGEGAHDHSIKENQDLTYTATVEVLPELDVKGYNGLALTQGKVEITELEVDGVIKNLLDSQGQLVPAMGGLIQADGTQGSRPAQKGDFADIQFSGGIVTPTGVEEKPGMKGSRVLEIGSNSLIPGFEENLEGMRTGETKTFRVPFPADFYEKDMAGKDSEFTVTLNEIKEKKLPTLDDDFAKQVGYEGVSDMRAKAKEHLVTERTEAVQRQLKSDLLEAIIEKNQFEVPIALVQSQTRVLAQDVGSNLKQQGFNDEMIQEALASELDNLKKRAENQVRASLLLEAIAKQEKIEVKHEEIEAELEKMAVSMKTELEKLKDFYAKNPTRRDDLEFRIREDRTIQHLIAKAKVKTDK